MRLALWKQKDKYVALKILKKSEILKLKQVDHIMSEISILSQINHPFLVRGLPCTSGTASGPEQR